MSSDAKAAGRSLFWRILHNDFRIYWRGNATRKVAWTTSAVFRIGLILLLHLGAWAMLAPYRGAVPGGPELACLIVLSILGMSALHRSLEVLYNRGDLPLLLASPVPPRVVLQTRLAAITVTSLVDSLFLVLPLVDVAMFLFGGHWAWAFLAWFGVVLAVVPAAVLTTIVAVERIGARRARTLVQILGILLGMVGFVATQLPQYLQSGGSRAERATSRDLTQRDLLAWFEVPPLQQIADAASGAWQWLVPLVLVGPALFFLAQRSLALRFTRGAQVAAADVGSGAQSKPGMAEGAWRHAFVRSHQRTLVRTQLLLLRRDPLLLMRCAMQVITLAPMLLVAFMTKAAAGFGGMGMLASAIVPIQLAALRNANDEGSEFEAASPLHPRQRAWMRTIAAALPVAVFAWIMAIVTGALAGPAPGVMVAIGGTLIAFATAWLTSCTTRVHSAEERSRNKPPRVVWQMLLGTIVGGLGAGGVVGVCLAFPYAGWILFAVATAIAVSLFRVAPQSGVDDL